MQTSEAPSLAVRVNALLQRAPQSAYQLLMEKFYTARRRASPAERAEFDLLRVRALNALTAFQRAALYCARALQVHAANPAAHAVIAPLYLEGARAEIFLGNLDAADALLARARSFAKNAPAVRANIAWLAARIEQERGHYAVAAQQLEALRGGIASQEDALAAARLERDIGYAHSFTEPARAEKILAHAREQFETLACPIDVALCDVWTARIYRHYGDFMRARALYAQSRELFAKHKLGFYVAWCDLGLGWVEWGINRLDAAIPPLERARAFFIAAGAHGEAASCEINLASIHLERYRYDDALPLLQTAFENARTHRRRKQAAVCLLSMAWAFDHQGRYAQAIEHYHRARAEYPPEDSVGPLVCDLYAGLAYFNLGQFSNALTNLNRAARRARAGHAKALYAEAEIYRAQTLLALRRTRSARRTLQRARQLLAETRQPVYAAFCDRLLAQTCAHDKPRALAHLRAARRAFQRARQPVETALCDLTQGELEIKWREWTRARRSLQRAQRQLSATYPDLMWRVEYGLGQIARAQRNADEALAHHMTAVKNIAQLRANLRLEEWSNSIFGTRQRVFDDALALSRRTGAHEMTLAILEAAKAQLFAQQLRQRDWRASSSETEQIAWSERERALRQELATVRGHLAVEAGQWQGALWSDNATLRATEHATLTRLKTLTAAYNDLFTQLQLTRQGLAGAPALAPFSLDAFRRALSARYGAQWAALNYYLVHDRLTIVLVDSETIEVNNIRLSPAERSMLDACTHPHPDMRERIYRGTVRGQAAPEMAALYLETLGAKLIPARVRAAKQNVTLLVSPHGKLHQLPFQALTQNGAPLLDRLTFVYAPSFQILTQLYANPPHASSPARQLLCGAGEFGTRGQPLHHTRAEILTLAKHAPDPVVLWQRNATREKILELNRSGVLAEFDTLHFATHAIIEPHAPYWSRILLADQDLTVADILDLQFNARMVTLSACASATGTPGAGDEWIGLARAFFYAGVRALTASLWQVDDKVTGALMARFYSHMSKTNSLAAALRAAQLELRDAGLPPFYWAPFVCMGAA